MRVDPHKAAPWVSIAQLLEKNQQRLEALECFKRAIAADPYNSFVRYKYGLALAQSGDLDRAISEYDFAIRLNSNDASIYTARAVAFEHQGEPAKAAASYRNALRIAPDNAQALGNLIALGRHVDVDDALENARAQVAAAHANIDELDDTSASIEEDNDDAPLGVGPVEAEEERDGRKDETDNNERNSKARFSMVAYGLGKELERRGEDDEEAFAAYASANGARKRATGAFNRKIYDRRIDKMCEIFSRDFYAERAEWGDSSEIPVFVVGLPRSGTTLTEQILASHPLCHGAGEIDALADMATGTPDRLGSNETPWPDCADQLTKEHIDALAKDYVARLTKGAPRNSIRVIDKQPLNFFHIGLIAMAFPNARILHCQRDLRDNGFSIFSENFAHSQRWSTDLADIAYYWRGYRRLMAHFRENLPINMLDVRYEETVADQEAASRRLLDFMGLEWDKSVLAFHKNDRAVQTPSRWQVRQPIYKKSAGRWQRFESHLGPLIEAWNKEGDPPISIV